MKSISYCREEFNDVLMGLCDIEFKKKFDDTFEDGHSIIAGLPFETSVSYFKYKKVLVVSPRDLTVMGKIHRVNETDAYLLARTCNLDRYPINKGIVRAEF
jgi:hypothetical protein